MSKIKGARLAGRRIDPSSPLGKELATLRGLFQRAGLARRAAQEAARPLERDFLGEDTRQRLKEASLRVPVSAEHTGTYDIEAWQRRKVIRERISKAISDAEATHGRRPTSIGVPQETYEEVAEACKDMDVVIVVGQ